MGAGDAEKMPNSTAIDVMMKYRERGDMYNNFYKHRPRLTLQKITNTLYFRGARRSFICFFKTQPIIKKVILLRKRKNA
jgi:hypothetical protein